MENKSIRLSADRPEKSMAIQKRSAGLGLVFVLCFLSTLFGGVLTMLMSVYLPVAVTDLLGKVNEDRLNEVSALINSLFIFGWMFGGFAWGLIADWIGRSKSFIFCTACYGLFAVLTPLMPSWSMVSACRFLTGFGVGGVLVTTTILVSELWPDQKRAVALGILSVAIPVGFFAAGAINNLLANWRAAFLVGIFPLLLSVISVFAIPETQKWKENKKMTADQREDTRKQLFAPVYRKDLLSGSVIFGAMLIGLWAIFSWAPTWVQSIASPADAARQRGLATMILAAGGLTGSFLSGWIVNGIGLRNTMLMCFGACFTLSFVVFKLNHSISTPAFIEMAVLAGFFGISQGTLAVYIPLLFPTLIRASATGFCFNIGRLFTATVVFFIGALVSFLNGYGNAIFIFSFIFLVGFFATWVTRQTKQTALAID
jgi:MFS family permease